MSRDRKVMLQEWEERLERKMEKHGEIHSEFKKHAEPHPDAVAHMDNVEAKREAAEKHMEKVKDAHKNDEHTVWDTMAKEMDKVMNEFKGAIDSAAAYFF